MSFVSELKRRKVFQVAAVYLVVAWLIMQVVDVVNEPLNLPDWLDAVVIVLLAVGFPIAVILAWAFDLTPEGVVRDQGSAVTVKSSGRRTEYALIGLLVVAVGWVLYRVEITPSEPAVEVVVEEAQREVLPNSVAVLPFTNLSIDPEEAFFAAGIHDTVLHELAKISDLNVIGRTSVLQYADGQTSISEIAEALNVETVLEATVQYADGQVRITAQLIDPDTGAHLWSGNYDRPFKDIFAIQSEIATRIAMALEAELLPAERQSIERPATNSPEAYALYLRAMATWDNNDVVISNPSLRASIKSDFDQAIKVDPNYALAYARRARLYAVTLNADVGTQENFVRRRVELENLALEDLDRALAIDPALGAAYGTLARIHQYNWRGADAEEAYERAIQLSPSNADAIGNYASFIALQRRFEEAFRLAQRAAELNPNSSRTHNTLGRTYWVAGDLDAAIASYRTAIEIDPTDAGNRMDSAGIEATRSNRMAALAELPIAEQLLGETTNPHFVADIAYIYGRIDQPDEATRLFESIQRSSALRRIAAPAWVLLYLAIGDQAQALYWLKDAADNPQPYEGHFATLRLKNNIWNDPILDQPEFVEVRSRLGFRE